MNAQRIRYCPAHHAPLGRLINRERWRTLINALSLPVLERPRVQRARPPARKPRAAREDLAAIMTREAFVVMLAAEDLAAGLPLSPTDRERLLESYLRLRSVWQQVARS